MTRWHFLWLLVLYGCVIALALMVVENRHHARRVFAEVQQFEKEQTQLDEEWNRFKLQQSTVMGRISVESQAKGDMGMQKPSAENIKVIRE